MAMGDGTRMLPVKADIRRAIGKAAGQEVTVLVEEEMTRKHGKNCSGLEPLSIASHAY